MVPNKKKRVLFSIWDSVFDQRSFHQPRLRKKDEEKLPLYLAMANVLAPTS